MIKLFAANKLVVHLDATDITKFITSNSSHSTFRIGYTEKYIEEVVNTKFPGLQIDNHLDWKNDIEQMAPQLSVASYGVRSMDRISNIITLKSIYCALFRFIINYGIILGGNSSNSRKNFTLQKPTIRTVAGA
jgi:hypothetical protein